MSGFGVQPTGPVQPGIDTSPVVPPAGAWGFLFGLAHLAVGVVSVALSVSEDFAAGVATFAGDVWRIVLGVSGGLLALLAVRGLVRVAGARGQTLTRERHRNARRRGRMVILLGAWLFTSTTVDAVARGSVAFESWAEPFFGAAGLYLVLLGLAFQRDPSAVLRRQQLASGPNVPGTATILGARDTGASVEEGPVMEIDLEIEANGRVYPASTRVVVGPAKAPLVASGSTVDVVVDLVDPNVFEIDWNSRRGPAEDPFA